ncbi:hypothetical protein E1091_06500 [Micromonospora fluostatini]|uniref:Carbohydrate kinase PfkB domain-containing protein n=1 Tax=Micromonospora fluostatini TaxID=1629071 RepID=A0ABY2DJ73_9ACTN|nr:hypothetical protein E1091_06500 [Micromonospora fluostatini]
MVGGSGPRGAACIRVDDSALMPAQHANAINTSGAGDTFLGTLAARLALQRPLSHAVPDGVAAATTLGRSGVQR